MLNHRNLVARIAAALLISIFLGVSARAQSPTPSFPVGSLAAYPTIVEANPRVTLEWSVTLPAGASNYATYIRQTQLPADFIWDASVTVASSGRALSPLPLGVGGSKFELWTIQLSSLTEYLLDTMFVASYVPTVRVIIRSEDPYFLLPRTRADRPFYVDITV